jgi:single-stranded-DNA-specific exonuclease
MEDVQIKEWIALPEVFVPEALRSAVGGHALVAQTLARRGFSDVAAAQAFLDPDWYQPAPPAELPGMAGAVERLERAIRLGETILVWGDFDVDGQTSTALLVSTLEDMAGRHGGSQGATVRFHIPHRQRESHGVTLSVLEHLIDEGVDLVLTCDTGVTAHDAVGFARARGVDVVITDHHDLPASLPNAHAVINPKMLPQAHPLRQLPGVGVAYKLAEALYDQVGHPEEVTQYLDLVALGIVADVAVQTGDVRYLLQRGLAALRHTERLGLRVMMELADTQAQRLTEEHIGFVLAPRMNALGRLADASSSVEFLTTGDLSRARILAAEMEGLNAQRKLLCDQIAQAAEAQLERDRSLLAYGALVLSDAHWEPGVIGVVAGRLAERYQKPTILIATPEGELGRGSARSVEGCDIRAAIAAHEEMLHRFGGHPMAAGLAIDPERIPEFRRALSRTVLEMLQAAEDRSVPLGSLQIDGYLPLAGLSLDLVEELERLAPFGPGNPPLTLASTSLSLTSHSPIGRTGEHLQLVVEDEEGMAQRVIWWQGAGSPLPQGRFDLAYVVRASDYRGQRDVQVEWVDARPIETPALPSAPAPAGEVDVVDYRRAPDPRRLLERLRSQGDVQVWREAGHKAEVMGRDRWELAPGQALAIWTTPPGPGELRAALEQVSPETVYLFGIDPGLDDVEGFLQRLAGLVKRALNAHGGRAGISTLATATAQREMTVRVGLAWLAARGHVRVLDGDEGEDEVRLVAGNGTAGGDLSQVTARLRELLQETAAYRAHFARADEEMLVAFR